MLASALLTLGLSLFVNSSNAQFYNYTGEMFYGASRLEDCQSKLLIVANQLNSLGRQVIHSKCQEFNSESPEHSSATINIRYDGAGLRMLEQTAQQFDGLTMDCDQKSAQIENVLSNSNYQVLAVYCSYGGSISDKITIDYFRTSETLSLIAIYDMAPIYSEKIQCEAHLSQIKVNLNARGLLPVYEICMKIRRGTFSDIYDYRPHIAYLNSYYDRLIQKSTLEFSTLEECQAYAAATGALLDSRGLPVIDSYCAFFRGKDSWMHAFTYKDEFSERELTTYTGTQHDSLDSCRTELEVSTRNLALPNRTILMAFCAKTRHKRFEPTVFFRED